MSNMPEPWGTWAEKAGLKSYRDIGNKVGLNHNTVRLTFLGKTKTPTAETIAGLAKALRRSEEEITHALGMESRSVRSYTPPPEAQLLDIRERNLVDELIRVLVRKRETTAESGSVRLTPVPQTEPESSEELSDQLLLESLPTTTLEFDPERHAAFMGDPGDDTWESC
ncbi:hypothetical protein [Trueperella sp. LYQ143]|uniref:hypothetical protein n=1 Tax=Trueperella sp. LYQ143 TaxID=3391059 RepID=UPI0039832DCE